MISELWELDKSLNAGTGLASVCTIFKTATSHHTQPSMSQINRKTPNSASLITLGEIAERDQAHGCLMLAGIDSFWMILGNEIWRAHYLSWAQYICRSLLVVFMWGAVIHFQEI